MFRKLALTGAVLLGITGGVWASHDNSSVPFENSYSESSYYINSSGHRVHRPVFSNTKPEGATAKCADGSYSFSEHRRGTCSYHGGVVTWY